MLTDDIHKTPYLILAQSKQSEVYFELLGGDSTIEGSKEWLAELNRSGLYKGREMFIVKIQETPK